MTTIAYRNGVMAADSFVIGDGVVYGNSRKITKNKNGDICGAGASSYDAVRAAAHHDTRTGGPIRTLRLGRD